MNKDMYDDRFVFPDDLQRLAEERLALPPVPEDYLQDTGCWDGRITEVSFKKPGQMVFYLDGRRSQVISLDEEECGWLEVGKLTPLQIAVHHASLHWTRFTRQAVQRTLFD